MVSIVELQLYFIFFLTLLLSLFLFVPYFFKTSKKPNSYFLPPSPSILSLVSHLHLLPTLPLCKFLGKLSSKYGHVLCLNLFNTRIVIVSSASAAYEVFRTQDLNLSSRDHDATGDSILFSSLGFITAPYGDYWRFMKKIAMRELLGQRHLNRSRDVRAEELERFYVTLLGKAKKGEAVEVKEQSAKLSSNTIFRMMIGRRFCEENGEADEAKDLISRSSAVVEKLILGHILRSFKRFGISLLAKEVSDISRRYDVLAEKFLREHEENQNREHKDMMDVLLEACNDEMSECRITRNHIKAFLVDIFLAGTDTSAMATEWIMAELISHPDVLNKVREELDSIVGPSGLLQESDLPNLPYLHAVMNEGLRLHPPGPFVPRTCREPCKIGGFDIPEKAVLLVNVYAIMRDPNLWEDPDKFRPERFLVSSSIRQRDNNKERVLKYAPFGGGRRRCLGEDLAYVSMGTAIGTMVHCFDWRINEEKKVNMEEVGGMALTMAHPLKCVPVLRFESFASTTIH